MALTKILDSNTNIRSQNKAIPPFFLTLTTTNILSKPSLHRILSIFTFRSLVSIRKTKLSFFFFTNWQSSLTVRRFPSPRQFQLIIFIAVGGAGPQPLSSPIHCFSLLKCLASALHHWALSLFFILYVFPWSLRQIKIYSLCIHFPSATFLAKNHRLL